MTEGHSFALAINNTYYYVWGGGNWSLAHSKLVYGSNSLHFYNY